MKIPRLESPFAQFCTKAVMLMVMVPFGAAKLTGDPFVVGEPGVAKVFQVTVDSAHVSSIWYACCVPPESVITISRVAETICALAGTWPLFGPMKIGNMRRDRQTVPEAMHPDASTSRRIAPP